MHARRSHRTTLRRVAMMAALAALITPAGAAEAAKKKRKPKQPVVTSVRPMQANIGETITVYGKNFVKGKARNTVVFKRAGARAVFVKADVATRRQIRVVLPERLADYLVLKDGQVSFTKFQIRVLAKRFGKAYTSPAKSPSIGPAPAKDEPAATAAPGTPAGEPPVQDQDGDCDGDGVKNSADADDDDDRLDDTLEATLKLDACKRDSDGDGAEDGYEYQSAKHLNDDRGDGTTPYPGSKPYPNPLFGGDVNSDFDGDGLTLLDEAKLWAAYGGRDLNNLNYSDGKQYSQSIAAVGYANQQAFLAAAAAKGYTQEALLDMDSYDHPDDANLAPLWLGFSGITDVERYYFDFDKNGLLSDDERDEDGDGLPNQTESHGPMTPEFWKAIYSQEQPYEIEYAGTEIDVADSDGDGVVDGADDQDHDGFSNVRELSRRLVAGERQDGDPAWTMGSDGRPDYLRPFDPRDADEPMWEIPWRAWVNPFNPCIPNRESRVCPRYVEAGDKYPPFGGVDAPVFFVFN